MLVGGPLGFSLWAIFCFLLVFLGFLSSVGSVGGFILFSRHYCHSISAFFDVARPRCVLLRSMGHSACLVFPSGWIFLFVSFGGLPLGGVACCFIYRLCCSVCFYGENNHSNTLLLAFAGV